MQRLDIRKCLIRSELPNSVLSRNSFGLIRLILASAVVFHHSLILSGNSSLRVYGGFDLGTIAVAGFFAVSGFLLLGSSRRLGPMQFLTRRFFRLFPGLWMCLVICAFALVPLASYFSIDESDMRIFGLEDSSLTFVVFNSALFVFQDSIGSVFSQNPFPLAVNGSLWTLAPEFICYLGLLVVALLARRNLGIQFALITLALIASSVTWWVTFESSHELYSNFINPASGVAIAFCTGSLLAIVAEYKPFRPRPVATIIGLSIWAIFGVAGPISIISLSLLIVFLGMSLVSSWFTQIGEDTDLSYGIYLYHFPIIQVILATMLLTWPANYSAFLLSIFALALSSLLAFVSWTLVEKPSISFARVRKSASRLER